MVKVTPIVSADYGLHVVQDDDGELLVHVVPSDGVRPVTQVRVPSAASGRPAEVTNLTLEATPADIVTDLQNASRLTKKYQTRVETYRQAEHRRARAAQREALLAQLAALDAEENP